MTFRHLAYGLATFIPGVARLPVGQGGGGTQSAPYCYSVWMRHLVLAARHGAGGVPRVVAELGPGNSLGIGIAALLSGVERYEAFDVVAHASAQGNLAVFEELLALFQARAPIPHEGVHAKVNPPLDDYAYPAALLEPLRAGALAPDRLRRLRESLRDPAAPGSLIRYRAPWFDAGAAEAHSVDLIFSQAVLEHVDDLDTTYAAMRRWLRPGGMVSHQVDFRSHGTSSRWNGQWGHSELVWKLYRGKRAFLLNRAPVSAHIALLAREGLRVVCDERQRQPSALPREALAPRFRALTDDDLTTAGAFLQAVAPA